MERGRITLRPASHQDREYLWWLHCETMRDYVDRTWGWDDADQRQRFEQSFDPRAIEIIVKDGAPVGAMSIRRPGDEIYLAAIEIAPAYQNQGIASQLIADLLEEADRSRLPVNLQVLKVNPARRLYERLGFRVTGETATHFLMTRGSQNR